MSVTDLGSEERGFERTPPHDIAAEQGVLGGMLLSQDAIAEVVEVLRTADFYRPAHQILYDAVLDLYGRGEPADAVTVAGELTKRGEIGRVGGAPYLHTLISSVPTAANAGYYAKIVRERSVLRKLVETGTRIVQMGYAADGADADDVLDRAQAEVFAIAEKRSGEDYLPLSEIMPDALDEIEAIGSRGGQMTGVPTGFADLDSLTNGLHAGQMIVVAARPAMGKALALDTPLPTPTGWTTMGRVRVGDRLIGADGRPTRVVAATEVMAGRPCFEIEFCDGETIVADADHQWRTTAHPSPATRTRHHRPLVHTHGLSVHINAPHAVAGRGSGHGRTVVLPGGCARGAVRTGSPGRRAVGTCRAEAGVTVTRTIADDLRRGVRHVVEHAASFTLPHADLPTDPLTLGVRLAKRQGTRIPARYLRASAEQRRALLQGLLGASPETFTCANEALAHDVRELALGLGRHAVVTAEPDGYHVAISAGTGRTIVAVRPVHSVPVRCVQVDNADHLYLAGRSCVPTHNSTLALDFARAASIKHGLTSAFFSLEMGRNEITMRLLSAEARVALHAMRSGTMQDEDWTRLARRMSEVAEAPLFIDDSPNMSMMEIRAKCRRLKQQHDLRLVIIDYLQLMSSGKRVESRQVEVSEFSRSLKLLAKELGVPVIALSQLNRGPEQRNDKKPMVSDLRESGSIEQDADMVILLHREDAYEKESPRAGEADLIVAKHRNGPTATVTVAFQGHYSRFVDMAQ
ncbi:replicative DNA helicase [Actinomadura rayongensis]|nr:replicative DNA helicase [Actinomadura rayongensis]